MAAANGPFPAAASKEWAHWVGGKGVDAHGPVDCGPLNIPPFANAGGAIWLGPN